MNNKLLFSDSRSSPVSAEAATDTKRIRYPCQPVLTIDALGKALDLKPSVLLELSDRASSEYRIAGKKRKPDGTVRVLWDARYPLKQIHTRIKERILDRVIFPAYLFGGIRGRSHISNAKSHRGAKMLIAEDVASFFPSITTQHVFGIWRYVFGFSKKVARVLTALTTRDGELPQGAQTSPHLANIALWKVEPSMVKNINCLGMKYSRFVDDINISSRRKHPLFVIQKAVKQVYGALNDAGFSPKLEKHEYSWRGRSMAVTKLNVDSKISLPPQRQKALRQDARRLATFLSCGDYSPLALKLARSLSSRAGAAKKFHPRLAKQVRLVTRRFGKPLTAKIAA